MLNDSKLIMHMNLYIMAFPFQFQQIMWNASINEHVK